jgi:Cu(I)-responsive transcriptional regulator
MNTGDVARRSGLSAKTIRHSEDIGLILPLRNANGYPAFHEADLHKLAFPARARALGFTIENFRTLLALYEGERPESASVKQAAEQRVAQIVEKMEQLQSMRATPAHLVGACAGDHRPDCPILQHLGKDAENADAHCLVSVR